MAKSFGTFRLEISAAIKATNAAAEVEILGGAQARQAANDLECLEIAVDALRDALNRQEAALVK